MDISCLTSSNLNIKQIVTLPTRKQEILDVCLTNLFPFYNAPVIIQPVDPDRPEYGVPSDHSTVLCLPHTNPSIPPRREFCCVQSRPMPESKIREFGSWIAAESWDEINNEDDPSKQALLLQELLISKVNAYFPKKTVKLGVGDRPFMTAELKILKRKRMREYRKRGKSEKYLKLKKEFNDKF